MEASGSRRELCRFLVLFCAFSYVLGACNESNWFGPSCQYACHCSRGAETCDVERGNCLADECQKGYNRTGCQYVNLALNQDVKTDMVMITGVKNQRQIVDGELKTCTLGERDSDKPVNVTIPEGSVVDMISVFLYKYYVEAGAGANATTLEVIFYDSNREPHTLQPTEISDVFLQYHLPKPTRVSRIQLRALRNSTLDVCEVSAFGGRNIALKKDAFRQKVINGANGNRNKAPVVVDGNADTCSHGHSKEGSGGDQQGTMWNVTFGGNTNVWGLKILPNQQKIPCKTWRTTIVKVKERIKMIRDQRDGEMNVTLRDSRGEVVYDSKQSIGSNIVLPRAFQASVLTVSLGPTGDNPPSLCEVEILGDCQDGYFGWNCDKTCRCADPSEICNKIWGHCPLSSCQSGYWSDDCSKECLPGTYGAICSQNCSEACLNSSCHHVTGQCTIGCKPGRDEPECRQDCPQGKYGVQCSDKCSTGCRDNDCDQVTGVCTQSCHTGWHGEKCDKACDSGYYGDMCSLPCSENCINKLCDLVSGDCLNGCQTGMEGPKCNTKKPLLNLSNRNQGEMTRLMAAAVVAVGVLLLH